MYYIGIDVGGMSIKGGISRGDKNIIFKKSVPTVPENGYNAFIYDLVGLIDALAIGAGIDKRDISGVGIGIPGMVSGGVIINAPNLGFNNAPLAEDLERLTGLRVAIENDADCAALCEYRFGEHVSDNMLLVTIGTGIGTGIICDGRLIRGFKGIGGEGGHITIKVNGRKCGCGRRGCFEQYASTSALLRDVAIAARSAQDSILAELARDKIDGFTVFDAVDKNCPVAKKLLDGYVSNLAIGIASLVNVCGAETVLIGGGVSAQEEKLIRPLRAALDAQLERNIKNGIETKLFKATFGNDAGILGAICAEKQ